MLERVHMTALRTLPCPLLRISIALVKHLYDQMAMQAHRGSAVDELGQGSLSHASEPPCSVSFGKQFCFLQYNVEESTVCLDGPAANRVEITYPDGGK